MDEFGKAVMTACVVAAVLAVARRVGPRLAGILTGLPVVTAPAMVWLAQASGDSFAAHSAVAGVAAGAMLAAFALLYAHAARRVGVLASVAMGLVGAGLLCLPALLASSNWMAALTFSSFVCAAALVALPRRRAAAPLAAGRSSAPALATATLTAASAAAVAAIAAAVAPSLGSFASGVVASLPVVSAAVAMAEHTAGGPAAVTEFLRGFVLGLFSRAAFCSVFALAVLPLGLTGAVALGCVAAAAVTATVALRQRRRPVAWA